jgi:hypothetical protein
MNVRQGIVSCRIVYLAPHTSDGAVEGTSKIGIISSMN